MATVVSIIAPAIAGVGVILTRAKHERSVIAAGAAALLLVLAVVAWVLIQRKPDAGMTRLAVPLPPADTLATGVHPLVALSADGRTLVYRAWRNGVIQLFRRALLNKKDER